MELAYLLCRGDFTKLDESISIFGIKIYSWGILHWDLERFLYQGEYLLRKKIVENIE